MKNKAIIHFQPLELYPPVQNLIMQLAKEKKGSHKIYVYTTFDKNTEAKTFKSDSHDIYLLRLARTGSHLNAFKRYFNYAVFYIRCFLSILYRNPSVVFYFETLSSYPAYLYKRYFRKKANIMVHYHEYTSPEEYAGGMKLSQYFHRCENWLYPKVAWVSHTNEFRMQRFLSDHHLLLIKHKYILPNFPPRSWQCIPRELINYPVKVIYVGALSLDTMYTKEFTNWVLAQNGNVVWNIYSQNITEEARIFIKSQPSQLIFLHDPVEYHELPGIFKAHDIGIVLYKGHIPNYIYNAPNKLFEYHNCGLDVWLPNVMIGSMSYLTEHTYPKILAIDFVNLNQLSISEMINRNGLIYKPGNYFCEEVLGPVCSPLLNQA